MKGLSRVKLRRSKSNEWAESLKQRKAPQNGRKEKNSWYREENWTGHREEQRRLQKETAKALREAERERAAGS